MNTPLPIDTWLPALSDIARHAGHVVMRVYAGDWKLRSKADASPVTEADELAEALITAELARLAPGIPTVAEEAFEAGRTPAIGDRFWLVDPLDGTREFIQRNGEFTVNIALVEGARPIIGVVHAPAIDRLFTGAIGHGAWVDDAQGHRAIRCRRPPPEGITVLASRSHGNEDALRQFLQGRLVAETKYSGSSLKLCLIAEGQADLYPRFGRTMEWDTAAGHAVLAAAGGRLSRIDGEAFFYGKRGFENPDFVASGLG